MISWKWNTQLVGVSTDGEGKMTDRLSGVATRIQELTHDVFVRLWCALHHLYLVLQAEYLPLHEYLFVHILTRLVSYVRRQQFHQHYSFYMLRVKTNALEIHEEAVSLLVEKSRYFLRLPRCEESGLYSSTFLVGEISFTVLCCYVYQFCRGAPARTH